MLVVSDIALALKTLDPFKDTETPEKQPEQTEQTQLKALDPFKDTETVSRHKLLNQLFKLKALDPFKDTETTTHTLNSVKGFAVKSPRSIQRY